MNAIAAVFHRDYKQRTTNIGFVFWDLFVPIAYLMLFGSGFQRAMGAGFSVGGTEVTYTAFFLPGVIAMTAFGIAMNTSWSFFIDKDSGIFYELLTYPITRRDLLLGKICFNVLLSITGSLLALLLGVLALGVQVRWDLLPLTVLFITLTTAGWFFMFSGLAIRVQRMDSFNTITSASYIILMFVSTMFYPIDTMPKWFQVVAYANPMTWQVDILRYSVLGTGTPSVVAAEAAGFLVFALLMLWMAARNMDRAV